jgi:hypothetical protein
MRPILIASLLAVLAGCGLGETATVAAVGAKTKAQEVEQAQAIEQKVIGDVETANRQAEQRLRDAEAK